MKNRVRWSFNASVLVLAVAIFSPRALAWNLADAIPQLSEFKDGRWQIIEGPATQPTAVEPDPQLEEIERLITAGRVKDAKARLITWLKTHYGAPQRDKALFLMAETQFRLAMGS